MSPEKTREIKISIPEEIFSIFFPEKTVDHLINAKKEALLALRSVIDYKIELLEKRGKKKSAKGKKINIE